MSDYYFLQANMHLLSDRKLAEMAWNLIEERKIIDKNLRHSASTRKQLETITKTISNIQNEIKKRRFYS
jgi:hypothetical protein